jgi:cell division protein FtsB
MNRSDEDAKPMRVVDLETSEPELHEALGNFRSSVTAWSEAMMSRPREAKAPARANWDLVAKWALGCVVFAGTVSGGLYQNYCQQEAAKAAAAAALAAEQQRELAAQKAKDQSAEDLMAKVDSDVAREVPSALEPLASLMTDDENKGN